MTLPSALMSPGTLYWLGLVAARYNGRWPDKLISGVTLSTISLPEFVAAYFVIYLLTQVFPIFQPVAMVFPGMGFWEKLQAVALPVIVLVLVVLAHMMRMTRAAILNVMQSAYIETAELKGLSPMRVIWQHAFPNAIAPIVMLRECSAHTNDGGFFVNISGVVATQPVAGMAAYSASTSSAMAGVLPLVTFLIVGRRCSLSPGLMRSGL